MINLETEIKWVSDCVEALLREREIYLDKINAEIDKLIMLKGNLTAQKIEKEFKEKVGV